MSDGAAPFPTFDAKKLIADVRKGDERAIRQAYAVTFGTEWGRLVLAHHLACSNVGARQGPGVSADDRHYAAGVHDAALQLAEMAGYGQAALAVAVLTDELTEENHAQSEDRLASQGFVPGPDDEF
jgi:hypothetical protein